MRCVVGNVSALIRQYRAEHARMLELRAANMVLFIDRERADLIRICDELYLAPDERPLLLRAEVQPSEAALEAHEQERQRLEQVRLQREPVLAILIRYFTLLNEAAELDASASDPNRFKGVRGDPGRLLREEKTRKRIAKERPKVRSVAAIVIDPSARGRASRDHPELGGAVRSSVHGQWRAVSRRVGGSDGRCRCGQGESAWGTGTQSDARARRARQDARTRRARADARPGRAQQDAGADPTSDHRRQHDSAPVARSAHGRSIERRQLDPHDDQAAADRPGRPDARVDARRQARADQLGLGVRRVVGVGHGPHRARPAAVVGSNGADADARLGRLALPRAHADEHLCAAPDDVPPATLDPEHRLERHRLDPHRLDVGDLRR